MNAPTCNRKIARTRSALQLTQAVRCSIESLEKRVFLSSALLYTVPDGGSHALVLSLVNVNGTPTVQLSNNGVVSQQALAATSGVAITGGTGNDSLVVDFSGGNPIPAGVALSFDGGAGSNSLTLANGSFTNETYAPSGAAAGTISLDASLVSYVNLGLITDTTSATNLMMRPTGADQTVNFANGLANTAEFF